MRMVRVLMGSSLLLAGPALGANLDGLYFGGSYGRARNGYDTARFDALTAAAAAPASVAFDDASRRRLAHIWWADAGYFFNPYLAVEAGFLHLGRFEYLAKGTISATASESIYVSDVIESAGPTVSFVGRLPLFEHFVLDLKLGDYVGRTMSLSTFRVESDLSYRTSQTSSSLLAGIGLAYAITEHWSLRADYLHIDRAGNSDTGKFRYEIAGVGLTFTF